MGGLRDRDITQLPVCVFKAIIVTVENVHGDDFSELLPYTHLRKRKQGLRKFLSTLTRVNLRNMGDPKSRVGEVLRKLPSVELKMYERHKA
jgi:hypothetical protein